MQIDWWTLGLQTVNFLLLVWLLTHFLYRPVREVIERRRQLAEEAFSKASEREAQADATRQRLENERAALSRQRQDVLKQAHEDLQAERQSILKQAQSESDKLLGDAREAIARERREALQKLRTEVADMATELAARMLQQGRFHDDEWTLKKLEEQLKNLPPDERRRLQEDLEANDCRIVVVTARALEPGAQARWIKRLNLCLQSEPKVEFLTAPELIAGAEVRLPHASLEFSWRDQLARAKELIDSHDPS